MRVTGKPNNRRQSDKILASSNFAVAAKRIEMNLDCEYIVNVQSMTEGRKWHWRSYGPVQYLLPVVGVSIILLSLWLYADESYKGPALPIALFLCGVWFLGRRHILGLKFANSVKKMPIFGKKVVWSFSETKQRHPLIK